MSTRLVIGCNYHTTWQSNKAMRFVLVEVKGLKARLKTRNTSKDFWTNIEDLIFIESDYNKRKAENLSKSPDTIPESIKQLLSQLK